MKHYHLSVPTGLKLHVHTELWTLFLTDELDRQCKVSSVKCQRFCIKRSSRPQPRGHGSAALPWGKTLVRGEATLNIWNEKDNSTVHTRATTHSLCFVSFLEMIKWLRAAVPQTLRLQSSDLDIGAFSPQKCWLKSFTQHCICKGLINARCLWKQ